MADGVGQTWKKYSVEDITAALDGVPSGNQEVKCTLLQSNNTNLLVRLLPCRTWPKLKLMGEREHSNGRQDLDPMRRRVSLTNLVQPLMALSPKLVRATSHLNKNQSRF